MLFVVKSPERNFQGFFICNYPIDVVYLCNKNHLYLNSKYNNMSYKGFLRKMEQKISKSKRKLPISKKMVIDNGSQFFFQNDETYGWNSPNTALLSAARISEDTSSPVKLVWDIEYNDKSYKQVVIAKIDFSKF